jgi:hypothetical protein
MTMALPSIKPEDFRPPPRRVPPTVEGKLPRILLLAALATAGVGACANNDANQVTQPYVVGMNEKMRATYSDGNLSMYEVQVPVPLPIRAPTDAEQSALSADDPPYPNTPFLKADDIRLEIRFTITNGDDQEHVVELLIDPWNEFVRWRPGVTVVSDEETTPNFSGWDQFVVIAGKSRVQGVLTPDDTHEIAIKLASCENVLAQASPPVTDGGMQQGVGSGGWNATGLCNHIMNIQNRSNTGDPLYVPYIPKDIAGLTGFDLGLRSFEAVNVAVEVTIDVMDLNGNRVVPQGKTDPQMGEPPVALSPPSARF